VPHGNPKGTRHREEARLPICQCERPIRHPKSRTSRQVSFPSAVFTGRGASRNRGEKKEFGKKNRRRTGPRGATLISPSRASHRRDWSAVSRAAMQFGVETLPPGCVSRLSRPARTFLARISRSSRS
jgi:hypothetical protein